MSGNVVWLASYPKSGNTWLRTFISNLLSGSDRPIHINHLLGKSAGERRLFDALTGIDSSNLFPEEADAMRPEVYKKISGEAQELCWIKVHDAYQYLPERQPLFPPEATRCTIYMVRNPLDVVPSNSRHMGKSIDETIRDMNDDNYAINSELNNVTNNLSQRLSNWSENVLSWLNAPSEMKVHVIRYEDMKKFPHETFGAAVSAMGLVKSQEEIRRAVEFSSFSTLKQMETQSGFREKPVHSDSFFREGKIGAGRDALTREQTELIVTKHKAVMQRFGYLDQQGNLVDD